MAVFRGDAAMKSGKLSNRVLAAIAAMIMTWSATTSAATPQPDETRSSPPEVQARLVQGEFASGQDRKRFERALAKQLGGAVRISNPADDASDGDGAADDYFGMSVAISGDTVLVGAPANDTRAGTGVGTAYVFLRIGTAWSLQAILRAPDPAQDDWFGAAVALSADTAAVGAPFAAGSAPDTGATHVFVRNGASWSHQAKLVAGDGAAADLFGTSVAISGNTVLVGAYGVNSSVRDTGAAYVFTRSGTAWSQQAKLTADDAALGDELGISVAVSGDTALVGAWGDDGAAGSSTGSAYVFFRSGTAWAQQAKLTADDAAASDEFGVSVAIAGDTAVVGAVHDDTTAIDAGSAYVFTRSAAAWSQQAKLTASDGAVGDNFGYSVAVHGESVVVGATLDDAGAASDFGSAYVFVRNGTAWSEQAKLTAGDGASGDYFGAFSGLSGDTAIIGAFNADTLAGRNAGAAYVFTRTGSDWSAPSRLTAGRSASGDLFGVSVALSGDTALVGAAARDTAAGSDAGSVFVFERSGASWLLQSELAAGDSAAGDLFGWSVSLSGDTALIGAVADDSAAGANSGSAYVFLRNGSTWSEQAKLLPGDGAGQDQFGYSVALASDTALVGAGGADTAGGENAGAAYVFVRNGTVWGPGQKLVAADGAGGDGFGGSVSLSGQSALIGAPFGNTGAIETGAAYVFAASAGGTWVQQAKLTADDGAGGDLFGSAVALSADTALIGAYRDDNAAGSDAGSAYVFVRNDEVWSQQSRLMASDGAANDEFGFSVALLVDRALVGAAHPGGRARGSAYEFLRTGNSWTEETRLSVSPPSARDLFGNAVALSEDRALVGAAFQDSEVTDEPAVGSVHVFAQRYPVTAVAIGNGTITPATQSVETGSAALFSAQPAANHALVEVTGDTCDPVPVGGNVWSAANITQACTVTARFAPMQYTVTATAVGNGTVLPPSRSVAHGATASFTLEPAAGWDIADPVTNPPGGTCPGVALNLATRVLTAGPVTAACGVRALFANQAPSFDGGGAQTVPAGSGARTVANWASNLRTGNDGPDGQSALFEVRAVSGGALLTAAPTVDPAGTLRYTVGTTAGLARFEVRAVDNGGTANGGRNASDWKPLDITVTGPGPSLSIGVQLPSTPAYVGESFAFLLRVRNVGSGNATGARVEWSPPAGMEAAMWFCEASAGAACAAEGTGAIDQLVSIPAGGSIEYLIEVPIAAGLPARVSSSANVRSGAGQSDPEPGDDVVNWTIDISGIFRDGLETRPPM